MKKYIKLLAFIVINSINIFSQDSIFNNLEYYRVTANYNGSAYNGNTILVYGVGGVIIRSLDDGNNWLQTNLNDSFNIVKITNINKNFFGIIDKRYIIKSIDDGRTWQQYDFGDTTDFYKIIAYDDKLYCLSKFRILILNHQMELLKNYSLISDTTYFDFTITNNNLIYSAGKGKLGIIDLTNDNTNFIDLKDIGICSDCPVIKNLFSDADITYFNLNYDLYEYDGNNIKLIFTPIKSGIYAANKGEVFELYNIINTSSNLDSLYFIKINKVTKKDLQIKKPGNDRYISGLIFKDLNFITKDTIIAVGKDKLIYMSYNRGTNWVLKSHFNVSSDYGDIFMFDSLHSNRASKYAKFVKTTDGGITWLPQKNYNPNFINLEFSDPSNFGKTFFSDKNNGFVYRQEKIKGELNLAYTKDGCETVNLKNVDELIINPPDKSYISLYHNNNIIFVIPSFYNNKYIVDKYTHIFRLNDTLGLIKRTFIDSAQILFMDKFENNVLYAILINYRYPRIENNHWYFDSLNYSLISSVDNGDSWNKEMDFDLPKSDFWPSSITKVKDNIFIPFTYYPIDFSSHKTDIFLLNIKTKQLNKILSDDSLYVNTYGIISINDRTYFNGNILTKDKWCAEILVNDDIDNQPTVWRALPPQKRYRYFISAKNDSLIYLFGYDSLFNSNVIWFAKSKKITGVEVQTEVLNKMYLTPPSPNPAKDFVKTRIYWDNNYDFEDASISVYNILGYQILDKKQFSFTQINSYSGELIWDSSNYPSGVYFISVKLGPNSITLPLVIIH
ncbi:MAG: hypothetical protein A2X61_11185 [Ignavibacteria bacterium GWB2_35_12]|nr:MAG: hypothetical protein A2X61_11185 [Ignavibacteria bacterium GWB2_35_12]OGV24000.1 MAG: hypothetical protein A2475_10830 [Ignavibacteria bacterium RIFOXYC2_FULL_35_21]